MGCADSCGDGTDLDPAAGRIRCSGGATVGIFGRTGAGKTALLRLLARLETPPEGAVLVDGVDLTRVDLGEWRRRTTLVPQAPFLWWTGDPPRADYDVAHRRRRQDLAPGELRYRETGSLYLTRVHVYREQRNRIGGRVALFVMDEVEGIDIDGPLDLELASRRLATLHPDPHPAPPPSAPHPSAPEETP